MNNLFFRVIRIVCRVAKPLQIILRSGLGFQFVTTSMRLRDNRFRDIWGGLKSTIRDKIGLQVVWTVDEAHNMALKAELMEKSSNHFSHYKKDMGESSNAAANRSRFSPSDGQGLAKTTADQVQRGSAPSNNFGGSRPITAATKETPRVVPNPYSKTGGFKCYMCGQPGHRSNECPTRKPVNFVDAEDYEGEDEQNFEGEGDMDELLDGAEIAEEQGEHVNCVIQRVMCSTKLEDFTQRNNIFKTCCSVQVRFVI